MGVIETPVHSESLGTFKSTSSMHSEERSRRLIENGDAVLFKYKRRKVSAVRDFPHGCGQVSSQVCLRPAEDVTHSVTAEIFVDVHPDVSRNSDMHVAGDYARSCRPVSPQINLSPAEDGACVASIEDLQGGLPEVPRKLEMHVSNNYPPGCGPVFPQINLSPSEDATCVASTEDLQGGLLEVPGKLEMHVSSNYPPGCGLVSPQINLCPAEDAACVASTEDLQGGLPKVPRKLEMNVSSNYPPGCGPVSPQINLSLVEDAAVVVCAEDLPGALPEVSGNSEMHVSRNYPPICGPVSPQINPSPAKDTVCAGILENLQDGLSKVPSNSDECVARDCALVCGTNSPHINLSPAEDAACAGSTVDLQFWLSEVPKNLDVHIARDFSPCCIPVSPKLKLGPDENAECACTTDDPLGRTHKVTKTLDAHVAANVVESVAELQPASTCQEDGQKLMEVNSLNNKSANDLESSKDSKLIDHENSIQHNISSLAKDLHETYVPIHEEEKSSSQKDLPIDCHVSVSNTIGLEKFVDRKFPPRRRVSAVRDFPPFCGRDAPLLSKQESVKANETNLDQVSEFDDKPSIEILKKNAKRMGESYHRGRANNDFLENNSKLSMDEVQDDYKVLTSNEREVKDETEIGTEVRREKCHKPSLSNFNQFNCNSDRNASDSLTIKKKLSDQYVYQSRKKMKSSVCSEIPSDGVIVQALMASSNCPWRQGKSLKGPESGTSQKSKVKKKIDLKISGEKSKIKTDAIRGGTGQQIILNETMLEHDNVFPSKKYKRTANAAHGGTAQPVIKDEDTLEHENHGFRIAHGPRSVDVSLTPGRSSRSGKALDSDATDPRTKVRETLRLFQVLCRRLLQEEEARSKKGGNSNKRVDLQAAKILKDKGKYVNLGKQIMGSVPGVEVGDEFRYRIELNIVGLHRQIQGGIDYVKHAGKILATSIVASGGYSDDLDSANTLVYTGQGGNVMNSGKEPEDQKLERGNLSMKNSFDEQNYVRVIRGSDVSEGRTYVYDGLYIVQKWWQDMGTHGKLVFKFLLNRIANQPELAWKELRKSTKFKVREGLCVEDISQGKESCPISAVNTIDDEKPPHFTYITRNIYPDWCSPIPPKGCDCSNGCSDSERCSCAVKNGGEIPYNHNEAIVEAKSLVYECGPKCKCPSSCCNRVSQKGIKFRLEIFKTESRGWGVRSLNSIPSGSFICEYIGEVIDEKEAEQRSNDEYLFDIGNSYKDSSLWDGLSTLMPDARASPSEVVGEGNFTIDAAKYGNVGRFINHCCFPNLYAQNVLYDFEDKRIPHIMLFAAENIPPLQELTYHYNYTIDQVRDPNGNIKKKSCYCGSVECTGRMY